MASAGYGGAEKVFVELSNGLAERHHQVIALLLRNCSYKDRFSHRVRLVELQANPTSHNPFLYAELYRVLNGLSCDIVHSHAVKGSVLVHRLNRFLGLAHLGTKHNDRKGRIFNRLRWVSVVSAKGAASVLSPQGRTIRVIYNGLAEEPVVSASSNEVFTLLAVGRLDAIKGFDILIDQVARLGFPFRLLVAGEGPQRGLLEEKVASLDLEDQVHFLGFREDIPQLMHDADLVVISSHKEGGPKTLAEALYYAPLALATPVGLVPEVFPRSLLTSHETLAADIERIYADYAGYCTMFADLCPPWRKAFSMEKMLADYETYYQEIMAGTL